MATAHSFRSRLIDFASLDTPLKRVVAVGYGLLLGLAALTALRGFFSATVLAVGYELQLAAVIIAGAALSCAMALLIAGASLARSAWRYAMIGAIFAAAIAIAGGDFTHQPATGLSALFFTIAASGLVVFGNRWPWPRVLAVAVLIVAVPIVVATTTGFVVGSNVVPTTVFVAMSFLVVVLTPALTVVGWDIAEIATEASAASLRLLSRLVHSENLAAVLAIILGLPLALWLSTQAGGTASGLLFRTIALGAFALFFVWAIAKARDGKALHGTVRYRSVLIGAIALVAADWAEIPFERQVPGVLNVPGGHKFSVVLPEGWAVSQHLKPLIADHFTKPTRVVLAPVGKDLPRVVIRGLPLNAQTRIPPRSATVVLSGDEAIEMKLAFAAGRGNWSFGTTRFKDKNQTEYALDYAMRIVDAGIPAANGVWHVLCPYALSEYKDTPPGCQEIFRSLQFENRSVRDPIAHAAFLHYWWTGIGLIGLLVLIAFNPASSLFEFLVWIAIVATIRNLGVEEHVGHQSAAVAESLSTQIMTSALWIALVVTFLATVEAARNSGTQLVGARATATSFLLTLIVAIGFFEAYVLASHLYASAADREQDANVIRGAIICVLLSWEFWTSGSSVTNHDSTHFPRAARIMIYLGYLVAVATVAFFFVRLHRVGKVDQVAFDAEAYVSAGIACLGLPYLIQHHVARLFDTGRHQ